MESGGGSDPSAALEGRLGDEGNRRHEGTEARRHEGRGKARREKWGGSEEERGSEEGTDRAVEHHCCVRTNLTAMDIVVILNLTTPRCNSRLGSLYGCLLFL